MRSWAGPDGAARHRRLQGNQALRCEEEPCSVEVALLTQGKRRIDITGRGGLSRRAEAANAPFTGEDVNGEVTMWNRKAVEISGYSEEDVMGRPLIEEPVTEDCKETVQQVLNQALHCEEEACNDEVAGLRAAQGHPNPKCQGLGCPGTWRRGRLSHSFAKSLRVVSPLAWLPEPFESSGADAESGGVGSPGCGRAQSVRPIV